MFVSPSYKCAISDICMRRTFSLMAQSQHQCRSLKMQYFLLYTVTILKSSLQVQMLVAEFPDTSLRAGCLNTFIT